MMEIRQGVESIDDWGFVASGQRIFAWQIECDRSWMEPIYSVGQRLSRTLEHALAQATESFGLVLVVSGFRSVRRAHRVQALKAVRAGAWGGFDSSGMSLPVGDRVQVDLSDGNVIRYSGYIDFGTPGVFSALELTRHGNAVVVMFRRSVDNSTRTSIVEAIARSGLRRSELLQAALDKIASGVLVARLHGEFDDRTITVQIFGRREDVPIV